MKILFNGCSMVEMGNCDAEAEWESKIWPRVLSDRLGAEYKNTAITMASNQRIVRTTIEQLVIDRPEVVIIGWTNMDRVELPVSNGDWARLTPYGSLNEKSQPNEPFNEVFYQKNYNDWLSFVQTVFGMFVLTEMCELFKIKTYYMNTVFHNFLSDYSFIKSKNFYNLKTRNFLYTEQINKDAEVIDKMLTKILNQTWLLDPGVTLVDLCKQKNWSMDQYGHPTISCQEDIANYFLEKITKTENQ